ncbi:cation-binding hemerythrin HHE [Azoarcus communis]|uniref:Cation-binding hemerythrin HHE n=1 Tax=Parazoarcus communis SWub3 = DSM 12120 TaxID=1121029 RepID=A0A323UQS9_9RHOO|nr:bacteriohemerythrin [Parazoarcus communis]NMG48867.1 cation-binding hemerythrin HHE [Parazoarcus communis]NMG72204.1 cation-binding hemerythrin HHE [Parazoarcus communis SWub3 = DSM 12120]PZA14844.1 cation-binding hemerythrin HHE [Azoarcus communis] [Parazoarcus communis SWub3 = DSM 12120]
MAQMQWTEQLELGLGRMDDTHREFVDLYNQVASAPAEQFLARLDAFIEHTEAHFDQENRWMEKVNFPGCHRAEHDRVMVVLRDVRNRVERGDGFLGRRLIEELPAWFDNHVGGMDAALAFHLDSIGFDVETCEIRGDAAAACADGRTSGGCACATPSAEGVEAAVAQG